jgi:chromosome segregation ATPase
MTYSEEQVQTTLTDHSRLIVRHENRLTDQEAAIARHDADMAEIRENLTQATQVLIRLVDAQEENRRQQELNQRHQEMNSEQIAALTASITNLRNTVADMVRREGGAPTV